MDLKNQLSRIGWKACPVHTQLGTANRRPMGLTDCVRVPIRVSTEALADKANARNKVLRRGAGKDPRRDQGAAVQGCYKGDNTPCRKFCVTNLSGGEEGGGTETSNKSEISELLCEDRTFQNGRSTHSATSHPSQRLDDKNGFEGCIPSNPNSPRQSTPPSVSMGRQGVPVSMSPIWTDFSTAGVLQSDETCGGHPQAHGHSSGDIPRRHFNSTSDKGRADTAHPFDLQIVRSPGPSCQLHKVSAKSTTENGVLGVCSGYSNTTFNFPSREAEENPTISTTSSSPTKCVSERSGKVCGQGLSIHESNMASPIALQSTAVFNQFSSAREIGSTRPCGFEIQCQSESHQGGEERSNLVAIPGQKAANAIPNIAQNTRHDNRVRCLQQGLGSSTGRTEYRGQVVTGGNLTPHKLSRAIGSLPGTAKLCQVQSLYDNSDKIGQRHSGDVYQQARGHAFSPVVSTGLDNMGMVPGERYTLTSRTSPREGECNSGSGIASDERSLRLDAKSPSIQSDRPGNGAITDRPLCFSTNEATTNVLQLEARSRITGNGCVQSRLVPEERICQSTMVPDCSLSKPNKEASSQSGDDHPLMGISTLVPNNPRNAGGVPQTPSNSGRPGDTAIRTRLHNEPGSANTSGMANLRESFRSQRISPEATNLILASWRSKTKSNYNSLFAKWAGWCESRSRDPTSGPVEDIVNFLAELFHDGYKYRSLNSYRSAISALHSTVDGHSIGQHPLVTRMLKGVYNERPPLPRYSSFWDVGTVLRHLQGWGENDKVSLRQLTLKLVMLMALTRPSRTMDLSKLDIGYRHFTTSGVLFKPQHLSKQSRPSKPLADFFYPRYAEDETICPVVTLQAYEARTIEFRSLSTDKKNSLLFLSWIGKHEPVTSSTIARWLKTCLSEAGINTEMFKAHSVRGASSSTAATAGVTTSDILQAADWSSVTTFQKFYLRSSQNPEDKTSFGKAVLSSGGSIKLTC